MWKNLETVIERKMKYQRKIIECMKSGLDLNQIALEVEHSEGSEFSRATFLVAIAEIREFGKKAVNTGMNRCFNCNGPVSILEKKCPVCNA